MDIEHRVDPASTLRTPGGEYRFGDIFCSNERTGAHVPEGDVYADGIAVGDIRNHEIFDVVLRHFGVQPDSTGLAGHDGAPERAGEVAPLVSGARAQFSSRAHREHRTSATQSEP